MADEIKGRAIGPMINPVKTPPGIRKLTKREEVQERHVAPPMACELNDYAHWCCNQGQSATGHVSLLRAYALAPKHPVVLAGLGSVLYDLGRYEEAAQKQHEAIEIEPEYAPAWSNLGSILGGLGRFEEAYACFDRALKLEPDYTDAKWNYAQTLLDGGGWKRAWPLYETRKLRAGKTIYPDFPWPTWKGESLNGKTLFVLGEQGVGDRVLLARYLGWIKDCWPNCRILFMVEASSLPDLSPFMYAYKDIAELLPKGVPWPKADYGVSLGSLPMIHGSTPDNVPRDPGCLLNHFLPQKKSVELTHKDNTMLRVGYAWTGNTVMKRNSDRTIPFDQLMDLFALPNVVNFSLQVGSDDVDKHAAGQLIGDLSDILKTRGFAGLAAIMLNLDLVVTACTSVAHVAGALGVPCWTMLCSNCYWVWLRGRSDSVWYPNMKLYRQTTQNDWGPVLSQVKADMAQLADETTAKRKLAA